LKTLGWLIFKMNKRGIFFTLVSIVLISLFLVTVVIMTSVGEDDSVQKRVKTLDAFVSAQEENLPREMFVSGYRTLFLIEQRITDTGGYVSDINGIFNEAFFNESFMGVPGGNDSLLYETSFQNITIRINERANLINANVSMTNPSLSVTQDDPWNVKMILDFDFYVEDFGGDVSWNRSMQVVSYIPIETFNDPFYIIGTAGLVGNKFVKNPYSSFESTSNLSDHIDKGYYVESSLAPNFLARLVGDSSASANYGIESIVDLDRLDAQNVPITEKSTIDHTYFSNTAHTYCTVSESGLPTWFRIEDTRDSDYNVTQLVCSSYP